MLYWVIATEADRPLERDCMLLWLGDVLFNVQNSLELLYFDLSSEEVPVGVEFFQLQSLIIILELHWYGGRVCWRRSIL